MVPCFGTTQRPDTRERSILQPKARCLANEEESIHAEGFCTTRVHGDRERAEVRESAAVYRLKRIASVTLRDDVLR